MVPISEQPDVPSWWDDVATDDVEPPRRERTVGLTAREREALRRSGERQPEPPTAQSVATSSAPAPAGDHPRPHLPAVPGRPASARTRRADRPAREPRRSPVDAVRRHAADLALLLLAAAVAVLLVAALSR
jgi:hypothetical protein